MGDFPIVVTPFGAIKSPVNFSGNLTPLTSRTECTLACAYRTHLLESRCSSIVRKQPFVNNPVLLKCLYKNI